jgi:uncharacterized transporter YbjL
VPVRRLHKILCRKLSGAHTQAAIRNAVKSDSTPGTGMQTQPVCLAYANQQARNELPNVRRVTVYPASMIAKIFLAQILVAALMKM